MAVEAARGALPNGGSRPASIWFATSEPAYWDKTNATTVHAALGLDRSIGAFDLGANSRAGAAAFLAASRDQGMAVLSDIRGGRVGSGDERMGADGAAAFLFGDKDILAHVVATSSVSEEFLDRWRTPGTVGAGTWEERFGEREYVGLAEKVFDDLLKSSGIAQGDISAVAVAGNNLRSVKSVTATLQRRTGGRADSTDLVNKFGNAGAAQLGLVTADTLDQAKPGELLLVVSLADGADAFLLRTTDRLLDGKASVRVAAGNGLSVTYPTYLLWRGLVERELPRRPDPVRPSAPFSARDREYKFAFSGGRCRTCGTVQFPLPRVCLRCRGVDSFDAVSAAGQRARVVTYTVDRLAFTPSPPLISAVLDLENGGRVQVELTDVDPATVAVGDEVALTFRRLVTIDGIHNYFWKASPIRLHANAGTQEGDGNGAEFNQ
ncbi:OB-fold domain-containing protein [Rhodococcus sp. KBS0724]|uniref:OB-fold domain-containing protein n=1 Tax=Rhodococcus sp. KBS0724 TaxID=1179674 RepID=UPI0021B12C8D|nr:OB-fold domain-containing protein [Rhodococcus sp. KBS0724]